LEVERKALSRPVAESIDMASIQKITLSALRDISFNKRVLTQSNVPRVRAGDGGHPGLRFHHQTAQSPGRRAVAGIVTRSGYAFPGHNPGESLSSWLSCHLHPDCRVAGYALPLSASPTLSHADCRTTSHAIHSRQKRLFTFHIIAVSGEATLHADQLYVQACQPATGHETGILFRTCQGRKDYHGGPNNFASLEFLNRPEDLARRIKEACRL
jgi:hypothetical protein